MNLPDILTALSGEKILTASEWETFRRGEIMSLFENFVYGVRPDALPESVGFEKVKSAVLFDNVDFEAVNMCALDMKIPFWIFMPKGCKNAPVFVYPLLDSQSERFDILHDRDCEIVPTEYITSRGYAVAVLPLYGIDPDEKGERKSGVRKAVKSNGKPNAWGTVSAWAWGMSRVADYLENDERFDKSKMIAVGHSRGGKTALWAGATDARFAMAVSNGSGCTGASVSRQTTGERIANINTSFPYWFCDNYKIYNNRENMLPIDQHMLVAMLAPRPVYVASATDDAWACPPNELLSCRLAGEVYALYGKKGLVCDVPLADTPYHDGSIGYHIKTDVHCLKPIDWQHFIDFADKKL